MRDRKKLLSLALTPALLGGLALTGQLAGASAASAEPHSCQVSKPDSNTGGAICRGGTGQARVLVTCRDGVTGNRYKVYGPWKGIGQWSYKACGSAHRVVVELVDYRTR
ncbi:hypothetical protein AB0M39_09030 [Streptomyces sp. NPDC051907]|uniref:hypothetical protein n=1 Tax=Streptomyces sp. NPDC051907 TaxID=3155284 RepID=UPI00341E93FD